MKSAVISQKQGEHQRTMLPPATPARSQAASLHPVLQLQQQIGNQAVLRMLSHTQSPFGTKPMLNQPGDHYEQEASRVSGEATRLPQASPAPPSLPIQAKLEIGAVDDPLEREADRVAEHVMRMPEPTSATTLDRNQIVRRKCTECKEEDEQHRKISRKESGGAAALDGTAAPPIVHDVLSTAGRPLDAASRAYFEPRLGVDLSGVRIHDDFQAAQSAGAVNANAYTVGNHIAFGRDYPERNELGRERLLAHELVHVAQQRGSLRGPIAQRQAAAVAPTVNEGTDFDGKLRLRIQDWRKAADDGLTNFAESELEDKQLQGPEADDASLAISLASGLMNALAAADPIPGAVIRPFIQKAATEVLKAVSGHQLKSGRVAGSDHPISAVKHALEVVLDQSEIAFKDGLPAVIADVIADARRTYYGVPHAVLTDAEVLNRAAIAMFGYDNVVGDGFNTEVNSMAVRLFYETEAREMLGRYRSQVHPIGEGRWGHKKVVLIQITGILSSLVDDPVYAQATRRVGSHDRYEYEFLEFVDSDMVAAAQARMDAADEAAIAVVPAQEIEGLNRAFWDPRDPNFMPRSSSPMPGYWRLYGG